MSESTEEKHTRTFLRALYADKPPDSFILIWELAGKHSRWYTDLEAAATETTGQRDRYVGVGLSPANFGPAHRCTADQIGGIAGLWADVDIHDERAHRKPNLPPDEHSALQILNSIRQLPTILVRSGYGLQAWWLFKEPWIFENQADRIAAAQLALRWNDLLRRQARTLGFDVDGTGDLPRVLRVPGTFNCKVETEPRPVRMAVLKNERRFNPTDALELLEDAGIPLIATATAGDRTVASFTVDIEANPPAEKLEALAKQSRRFRESLEHARKDLQDQSTSAYDMALAYYAATAEWSDQEIVNLLLYHQRRYRAQPRTNADYYTRTIHKAREAAQHQEKRRSAEGRVTQAPDIPREPPSNPEDTRKTLSELFNVEITAIVRYKVEPPKYQLRTAAGDIMLGTVDQLINQRLLRYHLANMGRILPSFKATAWEGICQSMLDICSNEEMPAETHTAGLVQSWLHSYLMKNRPTADEKIAAVRGTPLIRDNKILICLAHFFGWVQVALGERILDRNNFTIALKQIGAVNTRLQVQHPKTSKSVWALPFDPADYAP